MCSRIRTLAPQSIFVKQRTGSGEDVSMEEPLPFTQGRRNAQIGFQVGGGGDFNVCRVMDILRLKLQMRKEQTRSHDIH